MSDREPFTTVRSAVVPLLRDDVDTDQIIPARYLKATERSGFGSACFADWRYDRDGTARDGFVLNDPAMAGRRILLAGANFGCGSSREHAPWALLGWGFQVVIASSFADIFRANALKNGLLVVQLTPGDVAHVATLEAANPGAEMTVDLDTRRLTLADGTVIDFEVDPFSRSMLLEGTDELGYLLAREAEIAAFEASHPARVETLPPVS